MDDRNRHFLLHGRRKCHFCVPEKRNQADTIYIKKLRYSWQNFAIHAKLGQRGEYSMKQDNKISHTMRRGHKETGEKEAAGKEKMAYETELQFLNLVQMGNVNAVREFMEENPYLEYIGNKESFSQNTVRNVRYHFIIMVSMIARHCSEAGMQLELARHLNHLYVRQADLITDLTELKRLAERAFLDFTRRMMTVHKEKVFSQNVARCIDYIYNHSSDRITAQELAAYCRLHPSYLSRLFREEVGIGINEYIRKVKVESAKYMLKYSDDSYLTISNNLSFASQSHFVKVFREQTGMTPKRFREKYYGKGMEHQDENIFFSQF